MAGLCAFMLVLWDVFSQNVKQNGLENTGLAGALQALRGRLQAKGGDLVFRSGPVTEVIPALAQELGVSAVVAETEVEYK